MQIALKEDLDSLKEKLHTSKTHIYICMHAFKSASSDTYGWGIQLYMVGLGGRFHMGC